MNLTDKHVAGLTLRMLGVTGKMEEAKRCSLEALYALSERDLEWVKYLKENHGIEFDYNGKLRNLYIEAQNAIKNY